MCIAGVAVLGDIFLQSCQNLHLRALTDSCTHFGIAVFSWMSVELNCRQQNVCTKKCLFESIFCGFLSSAVDLDHFICAASFKLKAAVSLSSRPFLHCTTIPIIVLLVLHMSSRIFFKSERLKTLLRDLGWIQAIALVSHHLRDGHRRGIWICPFGSIKYPYVVYIPFTLLVCFTVAKARQILDRNLNKTLKIPSCFDA
ncbi:hypothetical protein QYM36_007332 [Artemia franciscana]|uniref:Transmembrane protein 267 n=2 Tax=Artemia franciscana TaxID=6661 RepID=A0AA88HXW6_ARTSF|nr:hypothetical protein QYM36_007332 [Artemia franciscana]KAK2717184.1 hypothetical protein QYM36_007332 [Artemia franciscana]KAK2717185.1 hypothetical protein QYM36_007332 [Artemia franciscana]